MNDAVTLGTDRLAPNASRGPQIRIMHVASGDLWAGAETQVCTLLDGLSKIGDFDVMAVLLNHGELEKRLAEIGVPLRVFDERRLSSARICLDLRRVLAEFQPHIVHSHRQKENVLATLAVMTTVPARLVRTQHGAPERPAGPLEWRKLAARSIDRWTARIGRATIVAVAPAVAEFLRSAHRAPRIVTIANGVDVERVIAAQVTAPFREREPSCFHVGFFGRLEPVKRVDVFLRTAAELVHRDAESGWRFHIFGDGSLKAHLEHLATKLKVNADVVFHGHDPDAARYLGSLDALLMCSDHEGLPMAVLEAMAAGTPVVAHAVGGMATVLADGAAGILVHCQSPKAFADALANLRSTSISELTSRALARIEQDFSALENAQKYKRLYTSLLR